MDLSSSRILITGATGSFGQAFVQDLLAHHSPQHIVVYSRDEYKHYTMLQAFGDFRDRLSFVVGDVRDARRLNEACAHVDIVIHAAALKHIPLMEENPEEAVKTNILGSQNVIHAARSQGVRSVVALSTDKAASPANLYGATKHVADKLFVAANGAHSDTRFSVVRYGNIAGSRGSVIPFFQNLIASGSQELPITDLRMTRFWISLQEGIQLVLKAMRLQKGGEIFVSKIPSFKVVDLARVMLPQGQLKEVGIRPGEKLHETMINEVDSHNTYEYASEYVIYPQLSWWNEDYLLPNGRKVPEGFTYVSDRNLDFLNEQGLKERLDELSQFQNKQLT